MSSKSVTTGGLGVLTTNTEAPEVTETLVAADLLKTLKVVTESGIDTVGGDVLGNSVLEVASAVEEEDGDLELLGGRDNSGELLDLLVAQFTGSLVKRNISLLADKDGKAATDTADSGKSDPDLSLAINVGVEDTKNVLEFSSSQTLSTHYTVKKKTKLPNLRYFKKRT